MKRNLINICLAGALALFCLDAAGQTSGGALSFVRIPRDAKSLGFAGAGAASASDASYAAFRNSAMLPYHDGTLDVAASYGSWAPASAASTTNFSLGAAWKLSDKFGVSLGAGYGLGESYDVIGSNGLTTGTFAPSELQVGVGFGWRIVDFLSLGANVKYASTTLAQGASYGGVSTDVFLASKFGDFGAALGVSSLGSSVKSAGGASFAQPASLTLAGSWNKVFGKNEVDARLDADYYFMGAFAAALGAEYCWNDMVSVRAGYRFASETVLPSMLTVGAGFKFAGFALDVAYLVMSPESMVSGGLALTLGYSF